MQRISSLAEGLASQEGLYSIQLPFWFWSDVDINDKHKSITEKSDQELRVLNFIVDKAS
jgi:hypothetical protein